MFSRGSFELFLLILFVEILCGSLMFSYWLGRHGRRDIRDISDGNPGATNLWRALGWKYGLTGLALDYVKGFLPLVLIVNYELFSGWQLAVVAVAPVAGHAFSPFMSFSGGKAVAVTFGIWSALTTWEGPVILGSIFTAFTVLRIVRRKGPTTPEEDAARVIAGIVALGVYAVLRGGPVLWKVWIMNLVILVYTHRKEIGELILSLSTGRNRGE
ncbi:MAG TPA: hypothetical protein DCE14_04185 [Kosmotogaceae bacterium]|nr:MAG: Glycerol-3-phosphate acyltransferase [Thermotogales bacterium 46_20]HAA85535.1 hypothetical protein [Kosmotogaceae bacterium]